MTDPGAAAAIAQLPSSLPVFPLGGVLLLPRGRLPLNVFEPRYLAMTEDALGAGRLIGIIQPALYPAGGPNPPLYRTGCAGRITRFSEDGPRFLITLTGLCRFDIVEEALTPRGYRRVVPDWQPYHGDVTEADAAVIDRPRLVAGLKLYFKQHGISADWAAIETTPDERLVTSLAMICPFRPEEKQRLLQAVDLAERAKLLTSLVEAAMLGGLDDAALRH